MKFHNTNYYNRLMITRRIRFDINNNQVNWNQNRKKWNQNGKKLDKKIKAFWMQKIFYIQNKKAKINKLN